MALHLLYPSVSKAGDRPDPLHTEDLRLRKAVRVSLKATLVPLKDARVAIIAALLCLAGWGASVWGQEAGGVGGVQSFGFSSSYSKTSSHILIGEATDRTIWTLGAEYTHLLYLDRYYRLQKESQQWESPHHSPE